MTSIYVDSLSMPDVKSIVSTSDENSLESNVGNIVQTSVKSTDMNPCSDTLDLLKF